MGRPATRRNFFNSIQHIMKPTVERSGSAIPISSGYTLDLYCCSCLGVKWDHVSAAGLVSTVTADGPDCYYQARRLARRRGWILHKDGYATCPKCANE